MSNRYSALVREGVDAFNRRDLSIVPKLLCEDVELRESPEWPEAGVYRGRDAFVGYFGRLMMSVDGVAGEVLDTVEEGEQVLARLRARGRDKQSGDAGEVTFSAIFTFRAGKCLCLEAFLDRDLAQRAWRERCERDSNTG